MKYFLIVLMMGVYSLCSSRPTVEFKPDTLNGLSPKLSHLIDSLKNALSSANSNEKFEIMFDLFREYLNVNRDTALAYVEKAYGQAKQHSDSLGMTKALNGKGFIFRNRGKLEEAIVVSETALGIAKRNNFSDQIKYLLNSLVLSYTANSAFDRALYYSFESLKVREKDGNPADISVALNNIGLVYDDLKDYENALRYFELGLEMRVKNNESYDLENSLNNISNVLICLGRLKEAESKINDVFKICDRIECRYNILAAANLTRGVIQFHQQNYMGAEKFIAKSLEYSRAIELSKFQALGYYWLAVIQNKLKKNSEAIYLIDKSLEIAKKSGFQNEVLLDYQLYSKIYSSSGDFKKAFYYQELYNILNDKILNGRLVNRITEIQINFKERENNKKIKNQAEIMKFQNEAIEGQKISNILIGIVALLTLGLSLVLYMIIRQKKSINKILDARIRERTIELEINRDLWKKSHYEQAIVLERISNCLNASLATLKGLSAIAIIDLPSDKLIYFKEIEATAEGMVKHLSNYLHENGNSGEK